MLKAKVISLIIVLLFVLSLSSCISRGREVTMSVGETYTFEVKDGNPSMGQLHHA